MNEFKDFGWEVVGPIQVTKWDWLFVRNHLIINDGTTAD